MNIKKTLLCLFGSLLLLLVNSCVSNAASSKIGPIDSKVEIFVTSWCPYCKKLEQFLQANDVEYTRYDVERDPVGASLHQELGAGGVPLIRVGKTIIRGFDQQELTSVLMSRRQKPVAAKT